MNDVEYAWRLGYDKRMEVALYGAGSFLASDLQPPVDLTEEETVAWQEGWKDATDSLKAAAFSAK
jgi:hypothetical protein